MKHLVRALLLAALGVCAALDNAVAECPPSFTKPTPEAVQAAMQNARDRGFLWRISKDGRTSYLFGTIHLAKLDWAFPGPAVKQALAATDTLALELDVMDPDIQARMVAAMAAWPKTTLPEALAGRIRHQAEVECVPYDSLATMAPEMQVVTLMLMAGRQDGLEPSYAIDAVLAGIGHGARKNVVSLETPEFQLSTLRMSTEKEAFDFVSASLDGLEDGRSRALLAQLGAAWANADYDKVEHYDQWCGCMESEVERKLMTRVLDDRNPGLARRIDELHQGGKRVFVAVGSLHMFGSSGLPALLAQRGYQVERVDYGRMTH